jgi:surface-anchored protein
MKLFLFLAAAVGFVPYSAGAYTTITNEHVDLQIEYVGGSLHGKIKADNEGNVARDQGLLFDGPLGSTSVTRPAGSTWDFLGVPAGGTLYLWPQNNSPSRIYLGFGSDGGTIPPGTLASYFESDPRVAGMAAWTKIELTGLRYEPAPDESGPANFSLWQTGTFGGPTVWMSTADGLTSTDATWLLEGGHAHYNWGFTKRGYYQLDFKFSGYLNGSNEYIESTTQTFHFGVEYQPLAIPEPAVVPLLGGAGLLLLLRLRRPRA